MLEYELKQSNDKVAHFLLIEEPEDHIHTYIQKTLFEKYGYQNTQVIISTHSTHISAASKIRSENILGPGRKPI
ncbi:AAA family ATPase [Paenibacillus sp. FSL M7-1046]|uniref:AAA family ATPase n=1 Tax=Paenibacillus sp. FSL M7-1046 TaxID=2975315 RepID=UPI0030F87556